LVCRLRDRQNDDGQIDTQKTAKPHEADVVPVKLRENVVLVHFGARKINCSQLVESFQRWGLCKKIILQSLEGP